MPFQAYAIDVWDGSPPQAAIFPANSGITFPMLMMGAQNGILSSYDTTYHYYFIIDGSGIIAWRGNFNDAAMRGAIDAAMAPLPADGGTWSELKVLFR